MKSFKQFLIEADTTSISNSATSGPPPGGFPKFTEPTPEYFVPSFVSPVFPYLNPGVPNPDAPPNPEEEEEDPEYDVDPVDIDRIFQDVEERLREIQEQFRNLTFEEFKKWLKETWGYDIYDAEGFDFIWTLILERAEEMVWELWDNLINGDRRYRQFRINEKPFLKQFDEWMERVRRRDLRGYEA
jgi:hypothetical protein